MKRSIALAVALAFLALGVPAIAGTTGGLNGTVTAADTKAPIAGAKVTVVSPSQTATTLTDASGHFAFVSLAPDEYTVSIEKIGLRPGSFPGVAVLRRRAADALALAAQDAADHRQRHVALGSRSRSAGHDRRSVFGQLRAAGSRRPV